MSRLHLRSGPTPNRPHRPARAGSLALLAAALSTLAAAVPTAAQGTYEEFKTRFEKAMEIGAKEDMARMVQSQEAHAIEYVVSTAEAVANNPSERVANRMEAIKEAWSTAKQSDFAKNMERYYSFLSPASARERQRVKSLYDKATRQFSEAEAAKEKSKLGLLAEEFKGYAKGFEEIGDKYFAGNAWLYRSLALDENHQGPKADLREVAHAYRRLIDLRKEIDLKDRFYRDVEPSLKRLEGLGFGGATNEEGAATGGPVAETGGAGMTVATTFTVMTELEGIERPSYFLDEHYPLWEAIRFGEVDSTSTLRRVENAPNFIRTGSNKIEIDLDRDGTGDAEVPTRGKLESVTLELGSGSAKRSWAFFAQVGNQTDQYQGVELSNAASDENWSIFLAPASSVKADFGGKVVEVFDDNMDGVYGSEPVTYGHVGLTPGLFQPEFDTVAVAGSKRAGPWSEFLKVGDQWMRLESQNGGAQISGTPVTMRTGKLVLDAKGLKPDFLIVQGTGELEKSFFELAGAKEVEVPVGRYNLYWGLVTKGEKKQLVKAMILPGPNSPTYEVIEGGSATVTVGAPFDFIFDKEVAAETIKIIGSSVTVVGAGGERYERVYGAVPRPEVSYRKTGSKRGSKPETMDIVQDRDGFDRKGGYAAMWKPLDLEIPKKENEDSIEVQLSEKKNKLFGKIDGTWR